MNKSIKWISLVIIAGIIFYFIYPRIFGKNQGDDEVSQNAGNSGAGKLPVSAVVIKPQKIEDKINVTGSVIANESVEIKSEISGLVKKIYFREGSYVKKGDLLISIDDDELVAQLEKLRYQKKLFEDREYRQRQLLEKEAISQEEYDVAITELNTAEADMKLISAQLAKTKIRAPFNGVIGLRYISEGGYVTPNAQIASLFNINPVKIDFSIPGKYSDRVNINDKIRFMTESVEDFQEATIYAIEPQIDPSTRTLKLRAISPNEDSKLFPGQFARIQLIFNVYENAIMAPTEAVIPELGGHKVFVFNNGKAQSVDVKVGLRTDREVEITNGLGAQDTLITSGILQLTSGMDVSLSVIN